MYLGLYGKYTLGVDKANKMIDQLGKQCVSLQTRIRELEHQEKYFLDQIAQLKVELNKEVHE
ncbi:hypothetical protein FACS18948_3720 [Clostridia bacterium]|nr:hypothetical protein FACS18948_3720 [Clostridia bacterium]